MRSRQMFKSIQLKMKRTEILCDTAMKNGEALNGVTGLPVDGWMLED